MNKTYNQVVEFLSEHVPNDHYVTQVHCEMDLLGGGWIRVFNMMAKPEVSQSAAEMYTIITR